MDKNKQRDGGILFMFHCVCNTGYAISSLEDVFLKAALYNYLPTQIFFSYVPIHNLNEIETISEDKRNIIYFDPETKSVEMFKRIGSVVKSNNITKVVAFDQQPHKPFFKYLRRAGVRYICSYQGAPMSDINNIIKLLLKKLQVLSYRHGPDMYVFESLAMANTGIYGRGIPKNKTAVVNLGVDIEKFAACLTQ